MKFQEWLNEHEACADGAEWAKENKITSASMAWKKLKRVDWMLWLVKVQGIKLSESELRHFAADCAEDVLHIYESKYPGDERPRKAIQAARDFADGKIDAAALAAALAAARSATRSAGGDAARYAAGAAARDAAWAAARDAAGAAVLAAAWAAARDAAGAAVLAAAWAAALAAARDAARDAAGKKQSNRLRKYFPNPFGRGKGGKP